MIPSGFPDRQARDLATCAGFVSFTWSLLGILGGGGLASFLPRITHMCVSHRPVWPCD